MICSETNLLLLSFVIWTLIVIEICNLFAVDTKTKTQLTLLDSVQMFISLSCLWILTYIKICSKTDWCFLSILVRFVGNSGMRVINIMKRSSRQPRFDLQITDLPDNGTKKTEMSLILIICFQHFFSVCPNFYLFTYVLIQTSNLRFDGEYRSMLQCWCCNFICIYTTCCHSSWFF